MDMLTLLEKECLDCLMGVRNHFDGRRISHYEFFAMMGQIRDCIAHLTNKRFGCVTGRHAGKCFCGSFDGEKNS